MNLNKKTKEGTEKRLEVLGRYYQGIDAFSKLLFNHPKFSKMVDDIIDAFCLAVTGMVGQEKGLRSVPELPRMDARGLLMQMVYAE